VTPEGKKEAYGEAIKAVGGRVGGGGSSGAAPEVEDNEEGAMDVDDEAMQKHMEEGGRTPFTFHGLPKQFAEDMIHAFNAKAIVDFTPGDGTLAEAALEAKILYLGFCHTEKHCELLREHLTERAVELMKTDASPLFNALYVVDLKKARRGSGGDSKTPKKDKAQKDKASAKKARKDKKDKKGKKDKRGKKAKRVKKVKRELDVGSGELEGEEDGAEEEDEQDEEGKGSGLEGSAAAESTPAASTDAEESAA
jgi:hypothetical protein